MSALAAGPACRALGIPHVDGMIQSGALEPDFTALKRLGMAMATLVVANTQAGLDAWDVPAQRDVSSTTGSTTRASRAAGDGGADTATRPSRS